MTLQKQPKPPTGARPFHIMETERDACGVCGMSAEKIIGGYEEFCPVILAANQAAIAAWEDVIKQRTE